jgi:hypothetical protein
VSCRTSVIAWFRAATPAVGVSFADATRVLKLLEATTFEELLSISLAKMP